MRCNISHWFNLTPRYCRILFVEFLCRFSRQFPNLQDAQCDSISVNLALCKYLRFISKMLHSLLDLFTIGSNVLQNIQETGDNHDGYGGNQSDSGHLSKGELIKGPVIQQLLEGRRRSLTYAGSGGRGRVWRNDFIRRRRTAGRSLGQSVAYTVIIRFWVQAFGEFWVYPFLR